LPDPPYCVRDKFESTGFVKTAGRLDKSQVSFIDQVRKAKTLVLVLLGNGYDKTQVCLTEFLKGLLVTGTDPLSQLYFFIGGDQFFLTDILKILIQRSGFPVGY